MPEITQTMRALLATNGRLLSTVVVRNETALEAHISMLRGYEHTCLVQHLAALPISVRDLDASARVSLALTYYGQLRQDIRWVKLFYRPNNAWPSRVFGGFARHLTDPRTSDLRVFHYLVATTDGPSPTFRDGICVRDADEHDLPRIEDWFTSRSRTVEVIANDLKPADVLLGSVSRLYGSAGLYRRRQPMVVERDGRVTGFALLEMSSLGLNLSELTNAFTVHLFEADAQSHLALTASARQRYAELGRLQCIALAEGTDLSLFEAAGFVKVKDYACWTFHRDHMMGLEEYFVTLFGARRRRNA
jgi:hypothetical protein